MTAKRPNNSAFKASKQVDVDVSSLDPKLLADIQSIIEEESSVWANAVEQSFDTENIKD